MSNPRLSPLPRLLVEDAVRMALKEDLGRAGDITTDAIIAADAQISAVIGARQAGCIAGLDLAQAAFHLLDDGIVFQRRVEDGDEVSAGSEVVHLAGNARAILSAERVALNYLGHLSGIATATRELVALTQGTRAQICDTRKTTPGLRLFEKYAVKAGGGANHRFGLDDAVLIKDNHIAAAGGIIRAIEAAKAATGHMVKIEVEVDTLDQLDLALKAGVDAVLLDNMNADTLGEAVRRIDGRALAEASGGVHAGTVAAIAASGVDMISVGALTHSAKVLDLGLDF
ncbi:MAG TPA: carboxylating nicotinate-nucleotide diphosphorylase [Rhizobiales bacterium]|nr:carboxylating nicotinate-nucleotide diphosphorylase [Hyphomicrobiales bacterium]